MHLLLLLSHDLILALRSRSGVLNPVLFFLITVSLFPFALGTENLVLQQAAAGIIWIAVLLASMLSLPFLLEEDREDGTLEQMLLADVWPPVLMLAKMLSHWLTTAFPLICISPLLGLMLSLPAEKLTQLFLSLLLGTPTISLIGAITATLTLGSRKSSSLITLLTLPFTIPVLIFGCIASTSQDAALTTTAFTLLGAFLLISLPVSLIACSSGLLAALRYR